MTSLASFTISGFFALTDGNQNNDLQCTCYHSMLACMNSHPVPAEIYTFNPSGVFLPDNTIAHLIGKAYYPPLGDCRPVIIETVIFVPFPGDPSSPAYAENLPNFPYLAVSAIGIVSSVPTTTDDRKVDFLVTAQDYVRGGMKTSTVMCTASLFPPVISPHSLPVVQMPVRQDTFSMEKRARPSAAHTSCHYHPLLREHTG